MKQLFLLSILILFSAQLSTAQNSLRYAKATTFIEKEGTVPFLISTRPVTNREYILFLIWINDVYGIDYPENIIQLLPGNLGDSAAYRALQYGASPFQNWYNHAEPFVRDYMLNPAYLDYPVIGITWFQASKCCHWLSDRYNEFFLIKNNYFTFDPNQNNEECFISEAYLADQYYGLRLIEKTAEWSDRLLLPCFRLPTSNEIAVAKTSAGIETTFKSYGLDQNDFLSLWNNYYLQPESDKIILKHAFGPDDTLMFNIANPNYTVKDYPALTLDRLPEQNNISVTDIFVQSGQALIAVSNEFEKDSVGQMHYIIIGETADQKPIAVARYQAGPDPDWAGPSYEPKPSAEMSDAELRCFYWACSIKKDSFKR